MIAGIRLKVCGITSLVDAAAADAIGADWLGFILHPASPRFVPLAQFSTMRPRLPDRPRVAVMVEPAPARLGEAVAAGFDLCQVHFGPEAADRLPAWEAEIGRERLWLAPRLAPGREPDPAWLPRAAAWLADAYSADQYGGTGRVADWARVRRWREAHRAVRWILAGGLGPANVAAALAATGVRALDVNSGVEAAPGVKDPAKLQALAAALRSAGSASAGA